MKLGWIPPLVIVVSIWYFMVMPNIPSYPIEYHNAINSPMNLGILMLVIMIMLFIIVLNPMEDTR